MRQRGKRTNDDDDDNGDDDDYDRTSKIKMRPLLKKIQKFNNPKLNFYCCCFEEHDEYEKS